MLNIRIMSAVIGGIILFLIVIINNLLVINIGVFAICSIAIWEIFHVVGIYNKKPLVILAYVGIFFINFNHYIKDGRMTNLFIIAYIFILLINLILFYEKINFTDISLVTLSIIYIGFSLVHVIYIRQLEYGGMLLWFVFLGAWVTDTAAYFTGMRFGKHKLIEKISPKKTIEGCIGGFAGCFLSFIIISSLIQFFNNVNIDYLSVTILSIICSGVAQIGDLVASAIKRQYHYKDFGTIMPGHGGILDRFDSILFVTPIVYYFSLYINVIY